MHEFYLSFGLFTFSAVIFRGCLSKTGSNDMKTKMKEDKKTSPQIFIRIAYILKINYFETKNLQKH